jgi:hypothetical protein
MVLGTMPYSMCTLCGGISHLNVGDVSRWYEEFHPNVPLGELVPGKCFFCWQELREGDEVIIRRPISENAKGKEGFRGRITEIYVDEAESGSIYLVKLEAGQELYFIRGELKKAL